MASTFAVTRNHLIFGICLPVALLLGYLLADAQDKVSRIVIGLALAGLSVPLLMRWYHPVLILCWNMTAAPALPGRPYLWTLIAFIGLLIAILNRSVNEQSRLAPVPQLTLPLLALLGVVGLTALFTGGVGIGALGSGTVGGKNYFYITAAIVGFFVLASRAVPPARAGLYVGLFFLAGVLAITPLVAAWIGPAANMVYKIFPPEFDPEGADGTLATIGSEIRLRGVATAATMVYFWLLARVGLAGVFDFRRPWWGTLFLLTLFGGIMGGYRSVAITMGLVFVLLFYLEGLWRTRVVVILGTILLIGGALLVGFIDKLPFSAQRTLSFLPVKVDPFVKSSAETSSEWRLEMWQMVWEKEVPKYLFRGKGYTFTADDLFMSNYAIQTGRARNWETALVAGDYHNGPLSLLIPFGIYGLLAFLWLVIAGWHFLYIAYRESPPELRRINALLLACFVGRSLFFLLVYGSAAHDLFYLTGILGLSVALNVRARAKTEAQPAVDLEPSPQI